MNDVRSTTPGAMLRRCGTLMLACGVIALAGCGGGGGGDAAPPPPPPAPDVSVSGWVGERSAWAQASIRLSCADGSERSTNSTAEGRYAATVPGAALPCLVQAQSSDGRTLWSAAAGAGTTNVTPLSDAIVARTLRQPTGSLFADAVFARRLSAPAIAAAHADLLASVGGATLGTEAHPITTAVSGTVATDPLVLANGRLLDDLSNKGVSAPLLSHALARRDRPTDIRAALAAGSARAALGLPAVQGVGAVEPQAVRGRFYWLQGTPAALFALSTDLTFASRDGARTWEPVPRLLYATQRFKGRLWGLGPDGLRASVDDGRTWGPAVEGSALGLPQPVGFGLDLSADGRLWLKRRCGHPCETPLPTLVTSDGIAWTETQELFGAVDWPTGEPPSRTYTLVDWNVVRTCVGTQCTESPALDWQISMLLPLNGSNEVVARGLTSPGVHAPLALSADGAQWRPLANIPFNRMVRVSPTRLVVRHAEVDQSPFASDDNGQHWAEAPITSGSDWRPAGADTRLRGSWPASLEMSVDAGAQWLSVPDADSRAAWVQSPGGAILRWQDDERHILLLSSDGGRTWTESLRLAGDTFGQALGWLGDRFGVGDSTGVLRTSRDGREWVRINAPPISGSMNAVAGTPGYWTLQTVELVCCFTGKVELWQSADQGRTWTAAPEPVKRTGAALSCNGALYASRQDAALYGESASELWVREASASAWRHIIVPAVIQRLRCERDALHLTPADARDHGELVSADHGATWTPIGRPSTLTSFDGARWWSVGRSSITLWPQ